MGRARKLAGWLWGETLDLDELQRLDDVPGDVASRVR